MPIEQAINFVIASATCAAAIASFFAASSAWKAARAAESQGEAAWAQVALQRPRPVVIVEGSWSLENSANSPDGFVLKNVGSTPAFDIEVSDIEGPVLKQNGYRERLTTDPIHVLQEDGEQKAIHHRHTPGIVIDLRAVNAFVENAGRTLPSMDESGNHILDHKLCFFVAYSTLEGRRIKTRCQIRFNLGVNSLQALIVPDSSWLGDDIGVEGVERIEI